MNESREKIDNMLRVIDVIARLRSPDGCPWDRKQTITSLKPFLLEECYELLEAIEQGEATAHRDELGDVLLQVLLQSRIREEQGDFDFADVAGHLADKMIRRHPHVFGDAKAETTEDVIAHWTRIKQAENKDGVSPGTLDGVPLQLPALLRAQRIQDKAGRVGFDWDAINDVIAKVDEELDEVREAIAAGDPDAVEDELGDLLFASVNLCRFRNVDAEGALRRAIQKFVQRFNAMEKKFLADGRCLEDCSLDEMDAAWNRIKAEARS